MKQKNWVVSHSWMSELLGVKVRAWTKSEARAKIKARFELPRLSPGTRLEETKEGDEG